MIASFTIVVTTQIHSDWFSWTSNALSDLGAIGTTDKEIYNIGMILTGLCGSVFGAGLVQYLKNPLSKLGSLIFISGMFFLVLVGWYESGTDPHVLVSQMFFGFTALGIFVTGTGEYIGGNDLGYVTLSIVLLGLVLAVWTSVKYSGAAIPELVGAISFSIFTLMHAGEMLGTTG